MKAASPMELPLSPRAMAIAEGLFRTNRAGRRGVFGQGVLRLKCKKGGYYWISLDGGRVLSGSKLSDAEELQPKFIEAMVRAGLS